jgi:cytochrome c biogenesis protein
MQGFFYPTVTTLDSGALASSFPELGDPRLSLNVYTGDLGLDAGVPRSVYQLDVGGLTQIAGGHTGTDAVQLGLGQTVDLPNGLGTISMTEVKKYISLDIHHDPAQIFVLVFAVLVIAGLLTGLFVPRRRVWIKATPREDGTVRVEYAGLARGEDPGLTDAVADLAKRQAAARGRAPSD